jgi:hypothetical protein
MPEIMIFKTGKYPQGDWPKERVQRMVDAYDPDKNIEAPVVIGHRFYADTNEAQFAHGWVKSLRMDGSGKVYADIPEFTSEVKQALAEKKLRYVSAEIYEFDKLDPNQPPYLRAVALLGRDTPAVTTTRLPSLFGLMGDGAMSVVDEKQHIAAFTRKVSAEELSILSSVGRQEETQHLQEEAMGDVEKLQAELARSNEQLAAFRKENEELKSAWKKNDATEFFGKLRDEGKLAPALLDRAVALDVKLGDEDRKELRALFGELSTTVDLTGTHVADKKRAGSPQAGSASLTAKIRAFQAEKKMATFADAAAALYAEKPELFDEGEEQ